MFDGSSALQLSNVMGGPLTVKSLTFTSAQTQPVAIATGTGQPLTFNTSGTILNVQSGSHTFTGTNSAGTGTPQCWFFSTTDSGVNYTYNIEANAVFTIAGRMGIGGNGTGVINLSGSGVGGTGAFRALGTGTFSSYSTAEFNLVTDAAIGVDASRLLIPYPIKTPSGTSAFTKLGSGTLQTGLSFHAMRGKYLGRERLCTKCSRRFLRQGPRCSEPAENRSRPRFPNAISGPVVQNGRGRGDL